MKYVLICLLVMLGLQHATAETPLSTTVLTQTNQTSIRNEVDDTSVDKVLRKITQSDPTKPFYIYLETPGGSVFAGRRLVNYLLSTNRNIVCIANTAISMGFVILQACPSRLATTNVILMTHQISSSVKGSLKELQAAVVMTEKLAFLYDSLMATRMGLTLEEYRAKLNPEFWMIGVKSALDNHAVDEVVKVRCDLILEKSTEKFDDQVISQCPIA